MKRRKQRSSEKPADMRQHGARPFGRGRAAKGQDRHRREAEEPQQKPLRRESNQQQLIGVVQSVGAFSEVRLMHRELGALPVRLTDSTAETGDVVRLELAGQRQGVTFGELVENMGPNPPGLAGLVAMLNHELPFAFPDSVLHEAEALPAFAKNADSARTDWTPLPIVTIDGEDARDFDDAVWAEAWEDAPGGAGHHIIVAIADVAHYVTHDSDLDREAVARGNSTYLPDRVIPMLPERLSNDLCSLRPHEDRPVLGVEMWLDAEGRMVRHTFRRGVIHSAARLTYTRVHQFLSGTDSDAPALPAAVTGNLRQLYAAFQTLSMARQRRGAMELDLPEAYLKLDETGRVKAVAARERNDAHRLIEELMILANVAAAETLAGKNVLKATGGLYRIHDRPDKTKILALKQALSPMGFTVPAPEASPKQWAQLAAQLSAHPAAQSLLRLVLQSQKQAKYSPANIGHYGLALPLYAHFTSPIRRYSDLVVHRALIAALQLPDAGGHLYDHPPALERLGEHLAVTERNSQHAEWEARDRLVALFYRDLLDDHDGDDAPVFDVVVVSVQPFGCFVAIDTVAEGLLPGRLLGDEWRYLPEQLCWMNRARKQTLRPGSRLPVRLISADAVLGRLTFAPVRDDSDHQGRGRVRSDARPVRRVRRQG